MAEETINEWVRPGFELTEETLSALEKSIAPTPAEVQALVMEIRQLRALAASFMAGDPDNDGWQPSDWLHMDETGSAQRLMEIDMERMRREGTQPQAEWTPRLGDKVRFVEGAEPSWIVGMVGHITHISADMNQYAITMVAEKVERYGIRRSEFIKFGD